MGKPWDNWIPGVLNKVQMQALVDEGILSAPNGMIGAASLDLTLTAEAYRMKRGSVKPGGDKRFSVILKDKALAEKLPVPPEGSFVLASQQTYVFEVAERLDAAFADIGLYGQATAKSSVGRVDVLARLIVDGMDQYEKFDAHAMRSQSGQMYLEITPFTFPVEVQVGKPLSQLRIFYGRPKDVEISSPEIFRTVFKDSANCDGSLSVDLENTSIGGLETAAFRATVGANCAPVRLWESDSLPNPVRAGNS